MKKLFYIVLLVVSLTGSCNKQITTIAITTSPIIVKTSALEATKAIISIPDKSAESEPSEPYIKDNTTIEMSNVVEIINNNISIPNVCDNAEIMIGSTQQAIDLFDICLMTEAAASFGQGQPVLLGGHNTKSLKFLYRTKINDIIEVTYLGIDYEYKVVYSHECTSNGMDLTDIETGLNMLDYNSNKEILHIYTCYNSNNWLVKAIRI